MTTTDTPRTDACPHCGAGNGLQYTGKINPVEIRIATCGTWLLPVSERTELCREREKSQKLEAEVERLNKALAFIANDNARHDSTSYYRSVAYAAINENKK